MIKVNKYDNEWGMRIELIFPNDNILNINYCGNEDLYLLPFLKKNDKVSDFDITLEDYDLYQIFNKLYNRIVNYLPFNADLTDYKFKYKEQYRKYPLVKNNNIMWYSDDDPEEMASLAIISKWDNKIHLKFQEGLHMEGLIATSIRIRTDGSRYDYFYIPFMEMYNEIWTTDFSYHQMNLDEYVRIRSKKS